MKAVLVEHRDEPGALKDVIDPAPKDGEVLVRVSAVGVNPIDWKTRDVYGHTLPFVLGQDFAGTVVSVGSKVTKFTVGDRLFGIAREHGSYAELTVVPESDTQQPVCKIPDDVGDSDAAALPTAALTALACVEAAGAASGASVAIIGATGGVGLYAMQIAKARDARVVAVAHSSTEQLARDFGADDFIAYDREDREARLQELNATGYDAIIDLVDDTSASAALAELIKPGGAIVSTINGVDPKRFQARNIRALNLMLNETPQSSHGGLKALLNLMHQGALRTHITVERGLVEATRVLDELKHGEISGKAVLTTDR